MTDTSREPYDAKHEPFVERLTRRGKKSDAERQAAMGALLVVRLLDRWELTTTDGTVEAAHRHQAAALLAHLDEAAPTAELLKLRSIVEGVMAYEPTAPTDRLMHAIREYATHLERDLRLAEANDFLRTVLHNCADALSQTSIVSVLLLEGRVCRKASLFEDALTAYGTAGRVAEAIGDGRGSLVSNLGQAAVIWRRGNLPEAQRRLIEVGTAAMTAGEETIAAAAKHELAVVVDEMGQLGQAICHMFGAYELYPDEDNKLFALHDLGLMLVRLGDFASADRALRSVLSKCAWENTKALARVALMELAIRRDDEVGFRNWQRKTATHRGAMTDELLATFHLRSAEGEARFSRPEASTEALDQAEIVARRAGLHGLEFEIERAREDLRVSTTFGATYPASVDPRDWEATRTVAEHLLNLSEVGT